MCESSAVCACANLQTRNSATERAAARNTTANTEHADAPTVSQPNGQRANHTHVQQKDPEEAGARFQPARPLSCWLMVCFLSVLLREVRSQHSPQSRQIGDERVPIASTQPTQPRQASSNLQVSLHRTRKACWIGLSFRLWTMLTGLHCAPHYRYLIAVAVAIPGSAPRLVVPCSVLAHLIVSHEAVMGWAAVVGLAAVVLVRATLDTARSALVPLQTGAWSGNAASTHCFQPSLIRLRS